MTIAKRYLDATAAADSAQYEIDEALYGFLGEDRDWESFGDPYDSSLEVFVPGIDPDLSDALGAFVLSLGFNCCWVHPHEGGRDKCGGVKCKTERYYFSRISISNS